MGVEAGIARATIRLSLGRFTTEEEVDRGAELILEAARG
jgi:cysteine sulfinate desulfinase/cysteine desulfurase-like protein